MKRFRFSILDLMALVALVAVELVVSRMLWGQARGGRREFVELFIVGVLPMANVLAIGMLRQIRARSGTNGTRRFWAGFEAFGGVAVLLFLLCSLVATRLLHEAVDSSVRPLVNPGRPFTHIIFAAVLLPQLALALVGGWLNTGFRVIVSRRVDVPASSLDRGHT